MCNKQDGQGEVIVYAGTNFNQRCFNDSNCTSGVEWIGRNFFDPFHTLPIPWNPRVDALIKHCNNQTWLALAMSDPLLLRVTLCMAAGFRGSQLPNFCPDLRKEGWRLKGEAIKEVNIALQEGRVTENLLAGIAHLGHLAGLDGSPEEADIHFQGLHRLITLRGGIQAIKTYQVGRFINWIDIELATARGRKPLYPLNFGLDKARLPACITEACETPSLSHLQDLGPGHENIIVVIKLHRQRVLTTRCNMDQTLRDIRTLSFSSTLLALNHVTHIPATPEESCILTMLLATLLFGFATLTQHHWIRCLPQIVAKRLRNSLQTGPEYSATWANYIPELFWILFVGSVIEAEDPQREETWFLSQLEEVWPLLHCKTRIELEAYLYSMVWDDKFGKAFIQTWCNDHNLL
ncbi:hypothetical protein BGZ63DRAFT_357820 [Mariannaea sp. PMI_226]|nr:hypothetical protein BGZ63DRAFT_357820 [Mariannaea sp. PMI_226]